MKKNNRIENKGPHNYSALPNRTPRDHKKGQQKIRKNETKIVMKMATVQNGLNQIYKYIQVEAFLPDRHNSFLLII
jgi:urease gamma subunit